MNHIINLITGFGRCGTTITTQILQAAGMEVMKDNTMHGQKECEDGRFVTDAVLPVEQWEECEGKVIKISWPQPMYLPRELKYRVFWMYRDHKAQATSMLKYIRDRARHQGIKGFSLRTHKEQELWLDRHERFVISGLLNMKNVVKLSGSSFERMREDPRGFLTILLPFFDLYNGDQSYGFQPLVDMIDPNCHGNPFELA